MSLTIRVPRFEELVEAAQQVYWAFAEVEPGERTEFSPLLEDIMRGLPHGRIRAAVREGEVMDIAVPPNPRAEQLPAAYICALVAVVTADWIWKEEADRWLRASTAAQAIAIRLQERHPQLCGADVAWHFDQVFSFAAGTLFGRRGRASTLGVVWTGPQHRRRQ